MPNFNEILNNRKSNELYASATPNVIVFFGEGDDQIIFGKHIPDSGLSVEDRALIVDNYKTPTLKINHENATTSFPSTSLDMLSVTGDLFNLLSNKSNFYNGDQCQIFLGFINAGMDFSEYAPEPRFKIDSLTQKQNGIVTFKLTSFINDGNKEAFQLSGATTNLVGLGLPQQILFLDLDGLWPNEGHILINEELVKYNNKSATAEPGEFSVDLIESRGQFDSIEDTHDIDSQIFFTDVLEDHPVDLILNLLTSTGEGTNGIYDILSDGAGILIDDIDIFSFNNVRAENPSDTFRLFVNQVSSALKFIESELLKPNSYRLAIGNKISLIFSANTFDVEEESDLNDDDIQSGGSSISLNVDSRKIINSFIVRWAKTPDGRFLRTSEFKVQESINVFGERREAIEIAGAQTDLFGLGIVNARALSRGLKFGFNQAKLKIKTVSRMGQFKAGSFVRLSTLLIGSVDSPISYDRVVEITSNSYSHLKSSCAIDALDSAWIKIPRLGKFHPTPRIINVFSQTIFSFLSAQAIEELKTGDVFKLFDSVTNEFLASGNRTVTAIVGDVIAIDSPFDVTTTTDHQLWPASYDDASDRQRDRFAYFSDEDNNFSDGKVPYVWDFA